MDDIADRAATVDVADAGLLAKGYRPYRRYQVTLTADDGARIEQSRDVLAGGKVVVVLPVDLARDEIVLIRQFRLAAHLGTGNGDMVEIVAGRVEAGEAAAATAGRECREEIGVTPSALAELFTYFTTPGVTDEQITVFVAAVDAAKVPARTVTGDEHIRTMRVPIDAALAALARNAIRNGPTIMALQWLALNRARLADVLRG